MGIIQTPWSTVCRNLAFKIKLLKLKTLMGGFLWSNRQADETKGMFEQGYMFHIFWCMCPLIVYLVFPEENTAVGQLKQECTHHLGSLFRQFVAFRNARNVSMCQYFMEPSNCMNSGH